MRLLFAFVFSFLCVASAVGQDASYEPDTSNPEGPELYAVFVTHSGCTWSNQDGFDKTVEQAKLLLEGQAEREGMGFVVRGVALDWDPREGMEYMLDRFGRFDELAAGRNWFGAEASTYIWQAEGGVPSTPQLIVFRRTLSPTETGMSYSADELVTRLVGYDEITQFVSNGGGVSLE